MPRPVATDPTRKAEALRLADELGPAEASRRTNIPASTIRMWRSRAGQAGAPTGANPASWAARKEKGAQDAWSAAQAALKTVTELLAAGKHADAQRASLSFAILTDKSGVLQQGAAAAQLQDVKITQEQASVLVAVLHGIFQDLGLGALLGPGTPGAAVVRHHLERAAGPAPDAEAAQQELRDAIEQRLNAAPVRQELPPIREAGGGGTQKLLVQSEPSPDMAPADDGHRTRGNDEPSADDLSGEDLSPTVKSLTVDELEEPDAEPAEEVVDAVLVDEPLYDDEIPPLFMAGYGSERLARPAWERAKRRQAERARKDAEQSHGFTTHRPSTWGPHSIFGPGSNMRPPPGGGA